MKVEEMNHIYLTPQYKVDIVKLINHLLLYGSYIYLSSRDQLLTYNGKYWIECNADIIRQRIKLHLYDSISMALLKEIYSQFLLTVSYPLADLPKPRDYLLNVKNGVLDLVTNTIGPYSPDYYMRSMIQVDYDKSAKCPNWLKFMNQICMGQECLKMVLQELFGYCLTGNNKYHKFFILLGNGGNGKSVYLEILRRLLGEQLTSSLPPDELSAKFRNIDLVGSNVNTSDECPSTKSLKGDLIKNLSSGGYIYVERKGKPPFKVLNSAKLIFSANLSQNLNEQSAGIERRICVIPFKFKVTKENIDHNIVEKLSSELPGILNWAIEGLRRLGENEGFTDSDHVTDAIQSFLTNTDTVKRFLSEHCIMSCDHTIQSHRLYCYYRRYCDEEGHKPCSSNEFGRRLRHYNDEIERVRGTTGDRNYSYLGIDMRDLESFDNTYKAEHRYY